MDKPIPRAVILDMDGTLLYTLEDIMDSVNLVLERFDMPKRNLETYRLGVGKGLGYLIRWVLPDENAKDREFVDLLTRKARDVYLSRGGPKTRIYDGMGDLLDRLSEWGVPMAINTNKPQDAAEQCVEKYLSSWDFDGVAGAMENRPMKPDPAGALMLARQMGSDPSETVFLGDSDIDMRTAIAGGMTPVGATWGFRDREHLLEAGAALLIDSPTDLVEMFSDYRIPKGSS